MTNLNRAIVRLTSGFSVLLLFCAPRAVMAETKTAVTTYHNDNLRTGWNQTETQLTPKRVGGKSFGRLKSIVLDDQVDAQPLLIPNQKITAGPKPGKHDVVYVATESNTVYAINAISGEILLHRNFGVPVYYPLGCNNNGPNVGITSTPVIDRASNTLYLMTYTQASGGPVYHLRAIDLGNFKNKVAPAVVAGSHQLTDGTVFNFNATYQRQRPGLLLVNGNIYAGFGSFCDFFAGVSRGWLLGWQAGSLTPLPGNQMFDTQATSPNSFFLSSIWMSGYGVSADAAGNLFFVTGNSDYSGTTYDGITNIQESVVEVSADLTQVLDLFTPSDQSLLDQYDGDFGSGGAMLLPDQPGSIPRLVVAAGKEGNMFLMNHDELGGYDPTGDHVLGTYFIGGCWCGQSYFVDPSDQAGRVVSSGANQVVVWKVETSPTVSLTNVAASSGLVSGQLPGFFTSVSSNGMQSPVIWALTRPTSSPYFIYLYAFDPEASSSTLKRIFVAKAGTWPSLNGNSNLVPVVANGRVFVASYKKLVIFGVK